jgi:hypothetical protein
VAVTSHLIIVVYICELLTLPNQSINLSIVLLTPLSRSFQQLEEGDVNAIELPALSVADSQGIASGAAGYTPYWVLPTNKVNVFAAAEINRWLFSLKVIIGRVSVGYDG